MVASCEIVQHTIAMLHGATGANHNTRGRRGNVILITKTLGAEVMVTGDLHGNRLNFERIVRLADLHAHERRHLVMQEVCHGGPSYPSTTSCMSHLLLEDVARLKTKYPDRFHFILGNHELAELADFPIAKRSCMLNLTFRCGLQQMYGAAAERIREAYLEFLRSCPLAVRLDGIFICHSAPGQIAEQGFDASVFDRPLADEDFEPGGPVFRLVWGRDFRAENAAAFAQLVNASALIHGHEPSPDGFQVPNQHQIILDCCGQRAGYLILPVGSELNHEQLLPLIRELS
jgi:hypothetical protein